MPCILLMLAGSVCIGTSAPAFAQHPGGGAAGGGARGSAPRGAPTGGGPHQHLDSRFSHNQYYYDRGYSVPRISGGGGEFRGPNGGRYWFSNGNWYNWHGGQWIVCPGPIGLFVPFLPPFYTTFWWYGVPYYYANDTYYWWDDTQQEYEVVTPPEGIEAPPATQAPTIDRLFIYPKNGQSSAQQAKDQLECQRWAVQQSGFDPSMPGAAPSSGDPRKRDEYLRAQVSCLEGRGYSVK